jgi:hypothetical protein
MSTKTSFGAIAVALLGAVLVFIGASSWLKGQEAINPQVNVPAPSSTTIPSVKKTSGTPAPALSYTKAVGIYADRRIQFNDQCAMIPNPAMLRNGKELMLDNRSAQSRSVTIAGTGYYLSGYGFKIITLSRSNLPATLNVNCGTGVNTGSIFLQ